MEDIKKFDCAFDQYLDDTVHEKIENEIYEIVKSAFHAGWNAAKKDQ